MVKIDRNTIHIAAALVYPKYICLYVQGNLEVVLKFDSSDYTVEMVH